MSAWPTVPKRQLSRQWRLGQPGVIHHWPTMGRYWPTKGRSWPTLKTVLADSERYYPTLTPVLAYSKRYGSTLNTVLAYSKRYRPTLKTVLSDLNTLLADFDAVLSDAATILAGSDTVLTNMLRNCPDRLLYSSSLFLGWNFLFSKLVIGKIKRNQRVLLYFESKLEITPAVQHNILSLY